MKKLLTVLIVGSIACLCFPLGWWILAFVWGFIAAVATLIWDGVTALYAAAIAGSLWAILAFVGIILIIIWLIFR